MKILRKGTTPDGIDVQLEDWRESFRLCMPFVVAAYPKKHCHIRASMEFDSYSEAEKALSDLVQGNRRVIAMDFTVMMPGGYHVPVRPILEKYEVYGI